jgi:lysozyme
MSLFTDIVGIFVPSTPHLIALAESIPQHEELRAAAAALATPDELQLADAGMQLIERDEGDKLTAYQDVRGIWTIGYGHTGPDVTPGLVITETAARALLETDLHKFEDGVRPAVGSAATSQNEFSAMVSLSYNIGLGGFRGSSVLRFHLAGQFDRAADAFLLWDKAGGQVYPGLVRRRHQERELYLGLAIDP